VDPMKVALKVRVLYQISWSSSTGAIVMCPQIMYAVQSRRTSEDIPDHRLPAERGAEHA